MWIYEKDNLGVGEAMAGRRKRKKRIAKVLAVLLLLTSLLTVALTAPYFNISSITCSGFEKVTQEELLIASGIVQGNNVFRTSLKKAKKGISQIPYVDAVEVKRKFPDRIVIKIEESVLAAYVTYEDMFIGIDRNGKILEISSEKEEGILTAGSLTVSAAVAGQTLEMEDGHLETLLTCINKFEELEVLTLIESIDVSNRVSVSFLTGDGLNVYLGSTEEIDYKAKLFKNILERGYKTGVFDISNPSQPTFRSQE